MRKKLVCAALAAAMALAMLPTAAFAQEPAETAWESAAGQAEHAIVQEQAPAAQEQEDAVPEQTGPEEQTPAAQEQEDAVPEQTGPEEQTPDVPGDTADEKTPDAHRQVTFASLPDAAPAENAVVEIADSADLVQAILGQADGQTWVFVKAGVFDAKNTTPGSNGVYTVPPEVYAYPFALPLYASDLTITKAPGVGEVILTSSYRPDAAAGGLWHNQNFITVYGRGVTIDGVNIRANANDYYDGVANKAIEIVTPASDFTLRNAVLYALRATGSGRGIRSSGSVYFGCADAGRSLVENVTMASWISGRHAGGLLTVNNVTQDYTAHRSAGAPGYRYGISNNAGDAVRVSGLRIIADGLSDLAEQVFGGFLYEGTVIELSDDAALDEIITIDKSLTLDANGFLLAGTGGFVVTGGAFSVRDVRMAGSAGGAAAWQAAGIEVFYNADIKLIDTAVDAYTTGVRVDHSHTGKAVSALEVQDAVITVPPGEDAVLVYGAEGGGRAQVNIVSGAFHGNIAAHGQTESDRVVIAGGTFTGEIADDVQFADDVVMDDERNVRVDNAALQATVDAFAGLHAAEYTPESWSAYETALRAAQEVLADVRATKAEIEAADTALRAAFAALEKAPPQPGKPAPPVMVAGAGAVWTQGSEQGLTFVSDALLPSSSR